MKWEKKICIRITVRRIMVAVLMASVVANLIIVGVVFGSEAFATPDTMTPLTSTPTERQGTTPIVTASMTSEVFTHTSAPSPTVTLASTDTPTEPPTVLPTLAICILRSDWPLYQVQPGDSLPRVARITGSTVEELMLANCLPNEIISTGQRLYVPRLPVNIPTFIPSVTATDPITVTPTSTITNTPYVPTITPTITQRIPETFIPSTELFFFQQAE